MKPMVSTTPSAVGRKFWTLGLSCQEGRCRLAKLLDLRADLMEEFVFW